MISFDKAIRSAEFIWSVWAYVLLGVMEISVRKLTLILPSVLEPLLVVITITPLAALTP